MIVNAATRRLPSRRRAEPSRRGGRIYPPRRTWSDRGGHAGDPDAARGVRPVPALLLLDIQRADPGPAGVSRIVEQVSRDDPHDLELQPVRVLAVQALGRAVVGCADE